jgi:uncharacterized Zn finger protein
MSAIKRGACPICGPGSIVEKARDEQDAPTWKCRNCGHEIPRRTWKTKKRKEREERINKTIKQLGWERALGMRGYDGSPAQREDRAAK